MADTPVFGIDLGTTNSCIALWDNGKVEVLANNYKQTTTPSCVAFTSTGVLVGNAAVWQQSTNPLQTIFEAKRIIGQNYRTIENEMKYLPFNMTKEAHPKYKVQLEGQEKLLHPEEISAIVLRQLKENAESYIQKEVKDVVITVPAYFNDRQRESTKVAGEIAGLNVIKVISEPVAAALAFGFSKNTKNEENILVYDLGGGTFDIAIVCTDSLGIYDVRATNGNTRLGGAKFIDRLFKFFVEKSKDIDTNFTPKEMAVIRSACEKAIKDLSNVEQTEIVVADKKVEITRIEYNRLIQQYIDLTIECVIHALQDADLDKSDIHKVVLVGGCTYTPLIRTSLEHFFGKNLNTDINPMEAVAYGACVQAAVLKRKPGAPSMYVRNIIPLTIGLITTNNQCCPIIKRNSPYPIEKKIKGRTRRDNQTNAKIVLVEGEQPNLKGNQKLGSMILSGLEKSPKGNEIIEVSVKIDEKGKITTTAIDMRTKKQNQIQIERPQQFSEEEVSAMTEMVSQLRKCDNHGDNQGDNSTIANLREIDSMNKRIKMDEKDDGGEVEVCPVYGPIKNAIVIELELGE